MTYWSCWLYGHDWEPSIERGPWTRTLERVGKCARCSKVNFLIGPSLFDSVGDSNE